MDSPVGAYHGAAVSAPIFKEVAQQVLEYLGVPHDEPMKDDSNAGADQDDGDSGTPEDSSDLQALFAEVNNLPADDPLRNGGNTQPAALSSDGGANGVSTAAAVAPAPAPTPAPRKTDDAELHDVEPMPDRTPFKSAAPPQAAPPLQASSTPPENGTAPENGTLVTDAKHRIAVPSFVGASVRQVVERAGTAGLAVQLLGNGLAREQAPAAGTLVPIGTEIVVRFVR
jgi:cell division protein FtsI (penicillin-binding protein 3)